MALDDDIRALARVDLFTELTPDQLRLLAFGAETLRYPTGYELYREGAAADTAFVILRGRVVLHRGADADPTIVEMIGEGAILGGFALIADTHRLTSATAMDETDAMRISRKLFRRILEEYPEAAAALYAHIAEEFQTMVSDIERLNERFSE